MTSAHSAGNEHATRLIVNADDLGQETARDQGIFALHACGAITSASLVVNAPHAANAARQAMRAGLPIGLHLNLGDGTAITGRSSLSDSNGLLPGKFGLRSKLAQGSISEHDLKAEIDAQFDHFVTLTGQPPTHVDGHHHCHVAPAVAAALAISMKQRAIALVRLSDSISDVNDTNHLCNAAPINPIESWSDIERGIGKDASQLSFYRQVQDEARQAEITFRQHHLHFPDRFCGIALMGEAMTVGRLRVCLMRIASSQARWVELMCHPGQRALSGSDFSRSPARRQEFDTLQSLLSRRHGEDWPFGLTPSAYKDLLPGNPWSPSTKPCAP